MDIKVTRTEYQQMAETVSPKSKVLRNCVMAFLVGGAICALGQALTTLFLSFDLPEKTAKAFVSISLIALSAIMTGLKVYDKIAKHAGAGTLVPITGFANSIVSLRWSSKAKAISWASAQRCFPSPGRCWSTAHAPPSSMG